MIFACAEGVKLPEREARTPKGPDGQLYSSYSHTFMPRRFPASRHRPTSLSQSSPMYSHSSPLRGYSIICPNPASRKSENIFSTSAASGLPVIAVNSISGEGISAQSLSAATTKSMQQHAAGQNARRQCGGPQISMAFSRQDRFRISRQIA